MMGILGSVGDWCVSPGVGSEALDEGAMGSAGGSPVVIQPPRLAHIAYYRAGNYQPPATCFMYINIRTSHEIE